MGVILVWARLAAYLWDMKITGPIKPGAATGTKKTQRKRGSEGGAFARALEGAEQSPKETRSVAATGPVAAIDALLALQGVADEGGEARRQAVARGHQLLDLLEEVRRGILLGVLSQATLQRLAELARDRKGRFTDPRLEEILAEIELRAEVELAKLERALGDDG